MDLDLFCGLALPSLLSDQPNEISLNQLLTFLFVWIMQLHFLYRRKWYWNTEIYWKVTHWVCHLFCEFSVYFLNSTLVEIRGCSSQINIQFGMDLVCPVCSSTGYQTYSGLLVAWVGTPVGWIMQTRSDDFNWLWLNSMMC